MELQTIQQRIYETRGLKVMLDYDLAELYDTETKVLKQSVKRNFGRFPPDFMFELSRNEYNFLRSQIVTLEIDKRGKHSKYLPYAFTEQGVAMLSSVLNSPKAIEINIQIIRAFVFLRNYALSNNEVMEQLKQLEAKYNQQFDDINEAINYLLKKDTQNKQQADRKKIGFSE